METPFLVPFDQIERNLHMVVLFRTRNVADFRPQAVALYLESEREPEHFQLVKFDEAIELISLLAEMLPDSWQRVIDSHFAVVQRGPLDMSTAWFGGPDLISSQV